MSIEKFNKNENYLCWEKLCGSYKGAKQQET